MSGIEIFYLLVLFKKTSLFYGGQTDVYSFESLVPSPFELLV